MDFIPGPTAMVIILLAKMEVSRADCFPCSDFMLGVNWGTTSIGSLVEASGLAASRRNPGVLWTHNDGSRQRMFAIATNGATLSTFSFTNDVEDTEDMAVGPGPAAGVSYLYLGDIGGNAHPGDVRDSVQILRIPEPTVSPAWAESPRSSAFTGIQSFTLRYPSGSYDAETLLVDPLNADLYVLTKENDGARLYRANVNTVTNGATVDLEYLGGVPFEKAAGGDISADRRQIVLRRENAAQIWARCDNESLVTALSRSGRTIPVIGPPTEKNGEAIAFLSDGSGYVTISEGDDQPIFYFQRDCLTPPSIEISVSGTRVRLQFQAVAGRVYSLEGVKGLPGGWTYSGRDIMPESNGPEAFEVERSPDQTFYRIVVR